MRRAFSLRAIGAGVHGETGLGVIPERALFNIPQDIHASYHVPGIKNVIDADAGWAHSAVIALRGAAKHHTHG